MLDLPLAFLAGVLTVAAPCVLPMLPILLGTAVGQGSRARPLLIVLGFVLTFSAATFVFGVFADALGVAQEGLRQGAILLLLGFGLLMVWPQPLEWLSARYGGALTALAPVGGAGNAGGFLVGTTLGVLWTPCAGPVLASILTLVATAQDLGRAGLLLVCYALGAGLPMLGIAYGGQYAVARVRHAAPHLRRVQQGFGVVVMLTGIAMHFQWDGQITVWLTAFLPTIELGL